MALQAGIAPLELGFQNALLIQGVKDDSLLRVLCGYLDHIPATHKAY
jgi:hypothetical protein